MHWRWIWPTRRLLSVAARERESYDCPHAIFDGGADDPRSLVYVYQQRLRAAVLARHPNAPSPARWTGSRGVGEARKLYAVTSYPDDEGAVADVSG